MTTIQQALAKWQDPNPFLNITKGSQLRSLCVNASKNSEPLQFFCWLIDGYTNSRWTVDLILKCLNELGFAPSSSIEVFGQWLTSAKWDVVLSQIDQQEKSCKSLLTKKDQQIKDLHSALEDDIAEIKKLVTEVPPKMLWNYNKCTTITVSGMKNLIASQTLLEPNCKWHFLDNTYRLFPHDYLSSFCEKSKYIADLHYVPERRDCDDFSIMLKGWLAFQGFGNVTVLPIEVNLYKGNVTKTAHAINLIITDEHKVFGFEPQEGHTFDLKKIEPWMALQGYTSQKIRAILV